MKAFPHRFYEFESFRVDAVGRRLLRGGRDVPLTSKTFDILLTLVENSGRTINKDELMQRVWADTFVEEGNLNRNISSLRKVLGDDGHEQRFIRTIPKQGYRFTAAVHEVVTDEPSILIENKTNVRLNVWEEVLETKDKTTHSRRFWAVVGLVLVLFGGLVSAWMWSQMANGSAVRTGMNGTRSTEAFDAYEKGRALWRTRKGEDLHDATVLLERSVQYDPQFALAHAALGDAYAFDYRNWPKAELAATTAISLDPNLGEAHATIGFVRMFWEWRLKEAEAELKKAVELSPNYATAHHWYAINLFATGEAGNAALAELKRAQELEPDSIAIAADICQALYFLHRYDDAIAQCQNVILRDEKNHNAYLYLYDVFNAKEMHDRAVETYFKVEETNGIPSPPLVQERLSRSYKTGGIRAFWKTRIETLPTQAPNRYRAAQHFARLGDKDEAFRHLRMAFDERDFDLIVFLADPVFDQLRPDPRYAALRSLLIGN